MAKATAVAPPSADKRWRLVESAMRRHGFRDDSLIETLHTVQECFGFLDEVALRYVAESLGLPLSKVFGVATFYHQYYKEEKGKKRKKRRIAALYRGSARSARSARRCRPAP